MSLEVYGLTVGYGAGPAVLRDVSFIATSGELSALIGPNGTGKSTLLKTVAGLLESKSDEVILDGAPLSDRRKRQDNVAYMPQDTGGRSSLTVMEVLLLGRLGSLGLRVPPALKEEALATLAHFGLQDLQSRTLDQLSGGQRQLVYLSQALFRKPRVLLLDEPTAALDLRHQLMVLEALRSHCRDHGIIAIAAMHDLMLVARFAGRLLCLSGGQMVANGRPAEVLTEERLSDVYGVRAEVFETPSGGVGISPLQALG